MNPWTPAAFNCSSLRFRIAGHDDRLLNLRADFLSECQVLGVRAAENNKVCIRTFVFVRDFDLEAGTSEEVLAKLRTGLPHRQVAPFKKKYLGTFSALARRRFGFEPQAFEWARGAPVALRHFHRPIESSRSGRGNYSRPPACGVGTRPLCLLQPATPRGLDQSSS